MSAQTAGDVPPTQSSDAAPSDGKQPSRSGSQAFLREVAIVLVCALVLSVLVRTFLVQAFYVPSQSMENTLLPNDRILASKVTTRFAGVNRGEVVVFKDPGGWLPPTQVQVTALQRVFEFIGLLPSSSGDDLVKRVIGIAGDHVVCCDEQQRIVLNGVSLDEPFIKPLGGTNQVQFDIVVPADSMFVMGDNRAESADSRYHLSVNSGAVPIGNVVGRVVLKVWPLDQFSGVGIPDVFSNPALGNQSTNGARPEATPSHPAN